MGIVKHSTRDRSDRTLQRLRLFSFLVAFLYILFGFFMQYVLRVDDLLPWSHRVAFALGFSGLAALSHTHLLVRKHMALFTYVLGCAAVLNVLLLGTQGVFSAGAITALLLVVPMMNFLFYRWKFLLSANALLLAVVVVGFAASDPTFVELLLFLVSSASLSGVSFWFIRRLLFIEVESATNERMFQNLFRHSLEGIAIHELIVDDKGAPVDYVFLEINPAFEKYTELKREDLIGKRVTSVLPSVDLTAFIAKYGKVVRTGDPICFEQFSDSLQRHYRVAAYPMGGNRFATALEDITDLQFAMEDAKSAQSMIEELHSVAIQLIKARTEQEVCELTLEAAEGILSFDLCSVGLVDGEWLRVRSVSRELEIIDIPRTRGLAGLCLQQGNSIVVADAQNDSRANPLKESYRGTMSIPIGNRGVFQAVSYKVNAFSSDDARLAELLITSTLAALGRLDFELAQKQREEQLAKRDRLLTKLSQQIPGVIYQYRYHQDGTSCFPFVSDSIWEVFEVKPNEVKDDAAIIYSRIHPEDYDKFVSSIRESFASLAVWELEYRVVLPEKGLCWVRGVARPEKLEDGSVLWHGYMTDMSDIKRIQDELHSKTEELERYFTSSLDLLCIVSTDGRFIRVNPEWESTLGYTVSELEGRSFLDYIHPEDLTATLKNIQQLDTTDRVLNFENRYLCKNGTYRWLEWRSTLIKNTIYSVARDVTDRRRIEDELRANEAASSSIIKAVPDVIFRLDRFGKFLDVITSDDERLFLSKEEYLGRKVADIIPREATGIIMQSIAAAFHTHTLQTCEFLLDVSADPAYYEARIVPVDEMTAYALVREITYRKQAEEKLVDYTIELEMRGFEMERVYTALEAEMQNARTAHRRLVQHRLPAAKGISLADFHKPATYIGGDFFQVIQREELLIVYAVDITGHGLEGTIFGLFVKGCIESYIDLVPKSELKPDMILAYLNTQVHQGGYPSEYAVAIFLMVMDSKTKELMFSAAGFQNPPVLVHNDGSMDMLASKGLPISPDIPADVMEFECHTVNMPEKAFVFLATDGIYEQRRGKDRYEQRLLGLLKQYGGLLHRTVKDLVTADFRSFLSDQDQHDDVTFLVLSTEDFDEHTLPSSWDSLDTVRDLVLSYYKDHFECETMVMAVHELVANAIEHGNRFDEDKKVRMFLSEKVVVVEDEGEGFDWRARLRNEVSLDLDQERGRGIAMTQMLIGKLVYNEKGNRVSLLLSS